MDTTLIQASLPPPCPNQKPALTTHRAPRPTPSPTEVQWLTNEVIGFQTARDLIVVDSAELTSIEDIVSQDVLAIVESERAHNLALIDDAHRDARYRYTSTPTIIGGHLDGDIYQLVVCTDRRGARWSGAIDAVAEQHEFVIDASSSPPTLRELTVQHDGEFATPGLSCVPSAIGDHAVQLVERVMGQLDAVAADPSLLPTTDVRAFASGIAADSLQDSLESLPTDRRRITQATYSYEALGVRGDLSPFHVLVAVCKHYPDGAIDELLTTRSHEPALAGVTPGISVEDRFTVFVDVREDGRISSTAVDVEPAASIGCAT